VPGNVGQQLLSRDPDLIVARVSAGEPVNYFKREKSATILKDLSLLPATPAASLDGDTPSGKFCKQL
jgi:hypothetical protein